VGDLYVGKKVSSLDELVEAPGPKRLTMTFLREIETGPFGKLLTRGVEDNVTKREMSKLVPGLIITAKGKVQGEPFKEPEFFNAIMAI
jgi:hypothetical protein